MISKTKNIITKLFFLIVLSFGIFSFSQADYKDFVNELRYINIDTNKLIENQTLTRYELTKLLNAVECKDCINPDSSFLRTYNSDYWSNFRLIAGNNFNDISYLGGEWNKQNYYYCVAYVGDNDYMNGYPLNTSPICAGKFCGTQKVSKSEFIQVVINLISNYIYNDLSTNRDSIKDWINELDKDSYQYKTLDANDIKIVEARSKECNNTCNLKDGNEVKTYLKYCMFNLNACGMTPIGKVSQGYWPVAELNLLKNQNIINIDQDYWSEIGGNADINKMLDILYRLNNEIDCSFDDDYDCDEVLNSKDNCSTTYNPSQRDLDKDKIGDVCDEDIDNDGVKNPIGIVDESGKINIRLWTKSTDNCLMVKNTDQQDTDSDGMGDKCDDLVDDHLSLYILVGNFTGTVPVTVSFKAVTNGKFNDISWTISDGYTSSGITSRHTFNKPGIYTIKAFAKGELNDAYASTTIIVGENPNNIQGISTTSNKLGGGNPFEAVLGLKYIGKYDWISWNFGDKEIIENPDRKFTKIFTKDGINTVVVKAIKNDIIVGISQFNLGIGNNNPGSILRSELLNPKIGENISISTDYSNFEAKDISYIEWNRGDGIVEKNTKLVHLHNYNVPGKKVIIQKIVLKNGVSMTNMITIYVFDKTLFDSKGMTVLPSSLSNTVGGKIGFDIKTLGNKIDSYINILLNYKPGISDIIYGNSNERYFDYIFTEGGLFYPSTKISINQCKYLKSDMTIYVGGNDLCLQEKINGNISKYKCDMDKDGMPDICDDDIDGDGVKNLLGIINYENNDCKISFADFDSKDLLNQISTENFSKHFKGICSLDNAPFISNTDQTDINLNGIGDAMDKQLLGNEEKISIFVGDSDGDGIADYKDKCMSIQETYNSIEDTDGCPEIGTDLACNTMISCGNGKIDPDETCISCPIDIGICNSVVDIDIKCGDKKIGPNENCVNCPQDVGECSNKCGNKEIDPDETCLTCPQDVGECISICGNGKIEQGETCLSCPQDFGNCPSSCGDKKINVGENCINCPEDVGICISVCGNNIAEPGETCLNCDNDISNCPNSCGNGKADIGETCFNCPEPGVQCIVNKYCGDKKINTSLGEQCDDGNKLNGDGCNIYCISENGIDKDTCGNGKIEQGEVCQNCPQDVQLCFPNCGNGIVETSLGEQCDNGFTKNGKDGVCSNSCYLVNNNLCGNGKIEQGETCLSCPQDVGICTSICGNSKNEPGENCINCPQDIANCPNSCGNGKSDVGENCINCPEKGTKCNLSDYCGDKKINTSLGEQCDDGNKINGDGCNIYCISENGIDKDTCGNGKIEQGEICQNCPQDVGVCFSNCGNGIVETSLGEQCDNGFTKNGKDGVCSNSCYLVNNNLCGNGKIEQGETCLTCPQDVGICINKCGNGELDPEETCVNCPQDVGVCDPDTDLKCGNGKIDINETCINCPQDVGDCDDEISISMGECLQCPCPYTDSDGDVKNGNKIRSRLWSAQMIIPYVSSSPWTIDF